MTLVTLGIAILGLLGLWLLGGFVLRLSGLLLFIAGSAGLTIGGDANGILVAAIGALCWLGGHWHYALRHQEYKSPLARHIFCRWAPAWLDPAQDWSVPVAPNRPDRSGR